MSAETIVTTTWIAAIRTQYGLDTRTPQAAGEAWGTHSLVAGAITALGHALDRVEALEKSMQAMTGDAAVREATKVVYSAAHLAMCNGGVLTPDQDLLRKALQAAVDVARVHPTTETAHDDQRRALACALSDLQDARSEIAHLKSVGRELERLLQAAEDELVRVRIMSSKELAELRKRRAAARQILRAATKQERGVHG